MLIRLSQAEQARLDENTVSASWAGTEGGLDGHLGQNGMVAQETRDTFPYGNSNEMTFTLFSKLF